jgi:prefoldin subunit 5
MISADVVDPRQGRATKAAIAFAVGYDSRSPDLAARVANDLVSLYLRENLESRKQLAAGSADFLTGEAEKLRLRVAELEQRISEFKEKNFDRLPEYAQANIQAMNRAMEELRDVDSRVRALDQQVVYLDAQLAQIDPNAQAVTKSGERMLSSVDRLQALRLELTAALAQYTTKHPVVSACSRKSTSCRSRWWGRGSRTPRQSRLHPDHCAA